MKESKFNNQFVFWGVILVIGSLLAWNTYATIAMGKLIGLIPISIQLLLLGLLITKSPYAKISVKIWALVFLVGGSGLQLIGRFMKDLDTNFTNFERSHYISTGFTVLIGVLITVFIDKTVEIIELKDEWIWRLKPSQALA